MVYSCGNRLAITPVMPFMEEAQVTVYHISSSSETLYTIPNDYTLLLLWYNAKAYFGENGNVRLAVHAPDGSLSYYIIDIPSVAYEHKFQTLSFNQPLEIYNNYTLRSSLSASCSLGVSLQYILRHDSHK